MRRQSGFTLVELLVVVVILGILGATSIPLYRTFQQRAYGSVAVLMYKQIMDAQILYFLENNKFYPDESGTITITHGTNAQDTAIENVKANLHITIPVGQFLDFTLESDNTTPGQESFYLTIEVTLDKEFPLFKGGQSPGKIFGSLNKDGKIETVLH